jgi:hypothetical protein
MYQINVDECALDETHECIEYATCIKSTGNYVKLMLYIVATDSVVTNGYEACRPIEEKT